MLDAKWHRILHCFRSQGGGRSSAGKTNIKKAARRRERGDITIHLISDHPERRPRTCGSRHAPLHTSRAQITPDHQPPEITSPRAHVLSRVTGDLELQISHRSRGSDLELQISRPRSRGSDSISRRSRGSDQISRASFAAWPMYAPGVRASSLLGFGFGFGFGFGETNRLSGGRATCSWRPPGCPGPGRRPSCPRRRPACHG